LLLIAIVVLAKVLFGQEKPKAPPPRTPDKVVALSPTGKLAYKAVKQELVQFQQDVMELQKSEIETQKLDPKCYLDFRMDQMVCPGEPVKVEVPTKEKK
jgi:hypothetical protein